jgi:hypothetical protein
LLPMLKPKPLSASVLGINTRENPYLSLVESMNTESIKLLTIALSLIS